MIVYVVMIKERDDLADGWWLDSVHRTRESAQKHIEKIKDDSELKECRTMIIPEGLYEDYD